MRFGACFFLPMPDDASTTVDTLLLDALRRRTGEPNLRYASEPSRVTGGFWAQIYGFRLDGGPPELDGDLIVRIMPDEAKAKREVIVQSEVVSQGCPAPRVLLAGDADDGLGRPFMVMERAPGRPPLPEVGGPTAFAAFGRAALVVPDLLARTAAQLHALDPEPLRRSLGALPAPIVDIHDFLGVLEERAGGAGRDDLK